MNRVPPTLPLRDPEARSVTIQLPDPPEPTVEFSVRQGCSLFNGTPYRRYKTAERR
jgi:hypothetical protein